MRTVVSAEFSIDVILYLSSLETMEFAPIPLETNHSTWVI